MTIYFISDLHLHASRPENTARFLRFLTEIADKASALYILGDFFEVWVGDDQWHEKTPLDHDTQVIQALAQYTSLGIPTYFMHGNRDFLIAHKFAAVTGCVLIADPYILEIDDTRYVLTHGDALCTRDLAYQRFRRIVRNPIFKMLFLCLPLTLRKKIAGGIRDKSKGSQARALLNDQTLNDNNSNSNNGIDSNDRKYHATKHENKYDVTEDAVLALLSKTNTHAIIHGHTHKAAIHKLDHRNLPAKRIVLGDWTTSNSFILKLDNNGPQLFDLNIALKSPL